MLQILKRLLLWTESIYRLILTRENLKSKSNHRATTRSSSSQALKKMPVPVTAHPRSAGTGSGKPLGDYDWLELMTGTSIPISPA